MLIIFILSLFTSATLLFLVQPMFAKMVLPKLGGTPAVWITCMVFYQAALLGGYAYAHLITSRLRVKRQLVLHLVLLLSAFLFLPIGMASAGTPPVEANPIPWLFMLLLLSVGLPFFVISTTAPLLQKWFALTLHPGAPDPYFLYVASNLGSMMALLGYPILVEPRLTLAQQSWAWSIGYGLLATLIVVCGVILWRSPGRQPPTDVMPAPSPSVIPEAPANISGDGELAPAILVGPVGLCPFEPPFRSYRIHHHRCCRGAAALGGSPGPLPLHLLPGLRASATRAFGLHGASPAVFHPGPIIFVFLGKAK